MGQFGVHIRIQQRQNCKKHPEFWQAAIFFLPSGVILGYNNEKCKEK